MRKDHSPLSFLCQEKVHFDDENDNIHKYMKDSMKLPAKITRIEKGLKKQIKNIDSKKKLNGTPEDDTTRYTTDLEEKKMN